VIAFFGAAVYILGKAGKGLLPFKSCDNPPAAGNASVLMPVLSRFDEPGCDRKIW